MPVTYQSPGVYIEEVDRGTKPIEAVGTSMAAFLGFTAEASLKKTDPESGQRVPAMSALNKATLVTSWAQYKDIFGDFVAGAYLPDAVYGYFGNGGGPCYVVSLRALRDGATATKPAGVAVPSKGRGASFRVAAKSPGGTGLVASTKIAEGDTFSLSIGGEVRSGLTMKPGENYVGDAIFALATIEAVGPANALPLDGDYPLVGGGIAPLTTKEVVGDPTLRTGLGGLEAMDDVRLVVCPDMMIGYDGTDEARQRVKMIQGEMVTHCQTLKYRFAILDTPPGLTAQQAQEWYKYLNLDTSYAALYYPWIKATDFSGAGTTTKLVPPCGHMAGIYNRSDAERGVHKAPANEVVLGAVDVELKLSKGEQDTLNPLGVNCIRPFPGRGVRVWGGRTLSSNGAWRYVNVRRLFIMVEASLDQGLQWVVFEPNDNTLWAKVLRDVGAFLKVVWRSGALFGTTPEQAFYVKCDEELNPPEIRDLGQLIIEVGMAPVKPAEFVIVRISQWAGMNAQA